MVDNTIALQVKPLDIATPLMQAAKMRQMESEQQRTQEADNRDAVASEMRGLAPYANSPDFAGRWTQSIDNLAQAGKMRPDIAARMRDQPSVMAMHSVLAQSESPQQQFQKQQLAETTRQHNATIGMQQAQLDELKTQHRLADEKPISVPAGATLVNPKTGAVTYSGTDGLSAAGTEIAARQIINGDLSALTNIGKGAQGDTKLSAIRNKAAELLVDEYGMSPKDAAGHLSTKLQEFKAAGVGANTEARTTAQRESNLNLILKATEAAIPAALEASDKVDWSRSGFVPLNKIIQSGQIMTSDAKLKQFGMANLQLAEHWARAMNPTGVMRESDRDKALSFLSTADTKATYKAVVEQLHTQITRERDAIRGGPTAPAGGSPAPGAGGSATGARATPAPGAAGGAGVVDYTSYFK